VVISISGENKEEVIPLSSLILQYLYNGGEDITGTEKSPFKLYSTEYISRDKPVITMWSKPFCYTNDSEKELAIIVIETRNSGNFENDPDINSKLFALSILISSIWIHESWNQIKVEELNYIQKIVNFYSKIYEHKQLFRYPFLIYSNFSDY
jgi:hypothetical protein